MLGYTLPQADTPLPTACWDTHPPAHCMLGYTPPCPVHAGIHTPSAQCMLGYTPPCPVHAGMDMGYCLRAERILLECILVSPIFTGTPPPRPSRWIRYSQDFFFGNSRFLIPLNLTGLPLKIITKGACSWARTNSNWLFFILLYVCFVTFYLTFHLSDIIQRRKIIRKSFNALSCTNITKHRRVHRQSILVYNVIL